MGSITGPTSDQLRFSVYAASAVQNKSKLYNTIGVTRSGYFTKVNPTEDADTIDTVVRLTGNKWFWHCNVFVTTSPSYMVVWQGYKELSGELTQLQFYAGSGAFDSGVMRVAYQ